MNQIIKVIILIILPLIGFADDFENYLAYRNGISDYSGDVKCATKYEIQLKFRMNDIFYNSYDNLYLLSFAPPIRTDSLVTEHFTLHWDITGIHSVPLEDISANGIPDYIDSAAVVLEYVWGVEIDQMNYDPPPQQNGQPVASYHVYFSDLPYYGLTTGSGIDISALPGTNWTSYLELENDYQESIFYTKGLDGLKVTAAHEFHHAIQLGYNIRQEEFFFYEMTSTWFEDVLYNQINDYYNYLPSLFNNLGNRSFNDYSLYAYGNCLYLHMLSKQYGNQIIQLIWEEIKVSNIINALNTTLSNSAYNSSWLSSLAQYGVWLYYTGHRSNPGSFFPEGENYPQINTNVYNEVEFNNFNEFESFVLSNSNKYLKIKNVDDNILLNISVQSTSTLNGGFSLLSLNEISDFYLNGEISNNFSARDSLVIVLTNAEENSDNYSISNRKPTELKINRNFPNPFNNKTTFLVELVNSTKFSLEIYNSIGEKVKVLQQKATKPGGFYIYNWYGDNIVGQRVASGLYFAFFASAKQNKTFKIIYMK